MGREIRKVIPNWEHPRTPCKHSPWKGGCRDAKLHGGMCHKPLHNQPFEDAAREWKEEFAKWERGEYPDYADDEDKTQEYWEWAGPPPDREFYRPAWTEAEATWYQVYETVSEGTPVSPAFATREELVEYLVAHGDYWNQWRGKGGVSREAATAFVMGDGFVPSMSVVDGLLTEGIEQADIK